MNSMTAFCLGNAAAFASAAVASAIGEWRELIGSARTRRRIPIVFLSMRTILPQTPQRSDER